MNLGRQMPKNVFMQAMFGIIVTCLFVLVSGAHAQNIAGFTSGEAVAGSELPPVKPVMACSALARLVLGLRPPERVLFVMKLPASSFAVELPVDLHAITVHSPVPGACFPTQSLETGNSSAA